MRKSLADQLANLTGRKNIAPEEYKTNSEKLDALHRLLVESQKIGSVRDIRALARLAIECGKENLAANLRLKEGTRRAPRRRPQDRPTRTSS